MTGIWSCFTTHIVGGCRYQMLRASLVLSIEIIFVSAEAIDGEENLICLMRRLTVRMLILVDHSKGVLILFLWL